MTTTYTRATHTDTGNGVLGFGVTDRLGRNIGIRWELGFRTFTAREDGEQYGWTNKTEGQVEYMYMTQTTRNGKDHQASRREYFATEAERDAALAKAIKGASKRALAPAARLRA